MNNEHYKTLEIPVNSSKNEVKKAFRKLAHIWHPDKIGGNEEKFKSINNAYSELMKAPEPTPFQKASGFDWSQQAQQHGDDVFSQWAKSQADMYSQRKRSSVEMQKSILRQRIHIKKMERDRAEQELMMLMQELKALIESE
jgi:DnaJ-class molecular chaperone